MNNTSIKTIQNLLDHLEHLGYSESMMKQIRPQIKKCAQVYNAPLDRIAVDAQDFEKRWGVGRVSSAALGFKSHDHFVDWRRRVRAAINRASQACTPEAELSAEWASLRDLVEAATHKGAIGSFAEISVATVGKAATKLSAQPGQLTPAIIDHAYAELSGRARAVFKRGLGILNKIIANPEKFPEIAGLLPDQQLPLPANTRRPPSPFRRGQPGTDRLWAGFDDVIAEKLEEAQMKQSTIADYEKGLRICSSALLEIGYLQMGQELCLWDLCNPKALVKFANFYQEGVENGRYKEKSTSLPVRIRKLCHLGNYVAETEREKDQLKKLKARVEKACPAGTKEMAPDRLKWIKEFSKSPAQQRVIHTMPEELMRRSAAILADWDRLKVHNKRKKRMEALHLGTAAVIAAILFRASPMRATNLRHLRVYGDNASITHNAGCETVNFYVEGSEVKNSCEIDAEGDADVANVIAWYLKEVRPRLIAHHPYCNLSDSDYLFPSQSPDAPACAATMGEHFNHGCRVAGIAMTLHQARHVCGYLILQVNPSAIGSVAALLNISEEVARRYYAWLDQAKVADTARSYLKQSRVDGRKHKRGTYRGA